MSEIIEKAIAVVEEKAAEFEETELKEHANWLAYYKNNKTYNPYDPYSRPYYESDIFDLDYRYWEYICEDCIGEKVEAVQALNNLGLITLEEVPAGTTITYQRLGFNMLVQSSDFLLCDKCYSHIRSSVVLSYQELDHWDGLKDEEICLNSPLHAYELKVIFEGYGDTAGELDPRIETLAARVVGIAEGIKENENAN